MTYKTEAFDLGTAAFANGIKCAPCLDIKVLELVRRENPTGVIGAPSTFEIFEAWSAGWHRANLSS